MNIGAADAGHFGAHEGGAGFDLRQRVVTRGERRVEIFQDGGFGGVH